MSTQTYVPASDRPLRLWPGVTAAALLVLIKYVLPVVAPGAQFFEVDVGLAGMLAAMAMSAVILVWWLFFSRARWSDRLIAIAVMALAIVAIRPLTDISIQRGMMGMMYFLFALPATLSLAFVAWAVVSRRLPEGSRRAAMVVAIVIGCGVWTLARNKGIHGGVAELDWRWAPTAEEVLMAQERDAPGAPAHPVAPSRTRPHPAHPAPPSRPQPHPAHPTYPAAPSRTQPHPTHPTHPAPLTHPTHLAAPSRTQPHLVHLVPPALIPRSRW